jgi:putative transcriptional regulator
VTERSVAPGFLIAMPQLPDPNFERSVVLMIEHGPSGSLGLVVNRPSELRLAEVIETLGFEWSGDPEAVIWNGGPVTPRSGWLLHEPIPEVEDGEGLIEVTHGIYLSTSAEHLRSVAAAPPARLRFLLGYAGWGAAQLESELASGSWLLAPATSQLLFDTPPELMWQAAIRSLGIDPGRLVPAQGVH